MKKLSFLGEQSLQAGVSPRVLFIYLFFLDKVVVFYFCVETLLPKI